MFYCVLIYDIVKLIIYLLYGRIKDKLILLSSSMCFYYFYLKKIRTILYCPQTLLRVVYILEVYINEVLLLIYIL